MEEIRTTRGWRRRKKWKIIGREKCCGAFVMAKSPFARYQDYFSQVCAKGQSRSCHVLGSTTLPFHNFCFFFFCAHLQGEAFGDLSCATPEFLITDLIKFLKHTKWFKHCMNSSFVLSGEFSMLSFRAHEALKFNMKTDKMNIFFSIYNGEVLFIPFA